MADRFPLTLGSLRSSITLTLHTHPATRLWQGRSGREGVHAIMGMAGYINITHSLRQASAQDDPFADWFMLQLEAQLLGAKAQMARLSEHVQHLQQRLPAQIDIGENLSTHPVSVPLFIGSPLGFLAVYLLIDFDHLVRRLLLAHHTALIGRADMQEGIEQGAHLIRSLFGTATRCRVSGVTRRDVTAGTARFQAALEKYGPLPDEVLAGTLRSPFAPPILTSPVEPDPVPGTEPDASHSHSHSEEGHAS